MTDEPGIHFQWMNEALEVANTALNVGEVPVGCVYVHRGEVIGRGFNKTNITLNGTRHSEFEGYAEIRDKYPDNFEEVLKETDLYVTVEPCIMCASLLRQLGVRRVFFGCANERFGGNGSVFRVNWDTPRTEPSVDKQYMSYPGLLQHEAIVLLRRFYMKENDKSPIALKKQRKLDLDTFPEVEYGKYLTRDQFIEMFGDGKVYDEGHEVTELVLRPAKRRKQL